MLSFKYRVVFMIKEIEKNKKKNEEDDLEKEKKRSRSQKSSTSKKSTKNVEDKEQSKTKFKRHHIILWIILFIIIVIIGFFYFINRVYLKGTLQTYDYLSFRTVNYDYDSNNSKLLNSKNDNCHIRLHSMTTSDDDLKKLGNIEKINGYDWVEQTYDHGITLLTYYKNNLYIIEMYAKDKDVYQDECAKDFAKIKKTFSFIKDE